jgi:hypothetical protein
VVGAAPGLIKLPQLYSRTADDLHDYVSELISLYDCLSFRSVAWSPHRSSDLARSVSRRVADVRHYPHGVGGRAEVSEDVGPDAVDPSLLPNFVDRMQWILV